MTEQDAPHRASTEQARTGQASTEQARTEQARTETTQPRSNWPLFEVFLRSKRGLNHVHVGSLHAADATMALHHARDLYTRRNEGVSIWVIKAADITASSPDEKDPFFAPSGDKVYRHPTFYEIPDSVPHI
jgi:ring-1,2-phenylacetyl-CoA epoxidase subunit PaaB